MSELNKFDSWINEGGPAALVIREQLEPVEGPDGVFFPATFAAEQGNDPDRFRGGYHIDQFPDGTNVCLVDTVGSQGNRIEPIFMAGDYAKLVPQVVITAGDKRFSILEAGHRSADAIVRCSVLKNDLELAFKEVLKGNAKPLAQIAPTSLVFGVWDSRGTYAKLPRLVSSTIRAFNVYRHKRHAQYNPVAHFKNEGLLDGIEASDDDLAEKGYVSQPIGKQPTGKTDPTHGGVQLMPNGSIRRDATLSLAALRRLAVRESNGALLTEQTQALRHYILGLALVALTAEQDTYLRQGCNLVPTKEGNSRTFKVVHPSGKRDDYTLTPGDAKKYAEAAATAFGVGKNREEPFDKKLAERDIKGEDAGNIQKYQACEVVMFDVEANTFTLKTTVDGNVQEIAVSTTADTKFKKGRSNKTFEELVRLGAKLDVELSNGVALKITGKN